MSFESNEEKLIDSVISVLDAGREKFTFQEIDLKSELRYKDLIIDLDRQEVIKSKVKVDLTVRGEMVHNKLIFCKEKIFDIYVEP